MRIHMVHVPQVGVINRDQGMANTGHRGQYPGSIDKGKAVFYANTVHAMPKSQRRQQMEHCTPAAHTHMG